MFSSMFFMDFLVIHIVLATSVIYLLVVVGSARGDYSPCPDTAMLGFFLTCIHIHIHIHVHTHTYTHIHTYTHTHTTLVYIRHISHLADFS